MTQKNEIEFERKFIFIRAQLHVDDVSIVLLGCECFIFLFKLEARCCLSLAGLQAAYHEM